MHFTALLFNPALLGILAVAASIVWMLVGQNDKTRPLLVFALLINLFYGAALSIVLGGESALLPYKYDVILLHIDKALGLSAASIALHLSGRVWNPLMAYVNRALLPLMVVFYLVQDSQESRGVTLRAYAAELVTGPMCYAILPACGPIYAFGETWLHPSFGAIRTIKLSCLPNAFPSLHVATAFLFVLLTRKGRSRALALVFFLSTAMATISTGEHFVIDLVAGLIFGCFAWAVGRGRWAAAWTYLGVVCSWALAIRFQYSALISHPYVLRACAACSLLIAAHAVMASWNTETAEVEEPELIQEWKLAG